MDDILSAEEKRLLGEKYENEDLMLSRHEDSVVKYDFMYKEFLKADYFGDLKSELWSDGSQNIACDDI